MAFPLPPSTRLFSRRRFLTVGLCSTAGLALYSSEIERHWVEVTERDVYLRGLPASFDGMRIAQISDIHMDEFTEPFFLRQVIDRVNQIKPDAVFITGDFVTAKLRMNIGSTKFALGAAWQCANILTELECKAIYASLGNHDVDVGAKEISDALTANGITVLTNAYMPVERGAGRISGWRGWTIRSRAIQIRIWPYPRRYAMYPTSPSFCCVMHRTTPTIC
jgi:predicted MPP superfamily phosphohydrolase